MIPSVLLTLVLQAWGATPAARTPAVMEEVGPRDPRPDPFPILLRMPRPVYPVIMLRAGIDGRVVVQALVNAEGRVEAASILVRQATHVEFIQPARQALAAALFRPGRFGGKAGAAWIVIAIDFNLTRE